MRLPRSVVFCLLVSMALVNLALRYPSTGHETGVDSFFIHNLTSSIVKDGNAEWILNPLSLAGLYPMSYPSAGPFLFAGVSDLAGLEVETVILILSLAFGVFGLAAAFVLAHEFRDDDAFAIFVAFLYVVAPRFLAFTLWTGSMRGLFMVVLPIFVWTILRAYRKPSTTNAAVVALTFVVLATVHRLGILMAVLVVGSIIAYLVIVVARILHIRIPGLVLTSLYRRVSPWLILGAVTAIAGAMLFGTDVLAAYSEGQLVSGASIGVELLNLSVSLARSVGVALVFAIGGLVTLARTRNKTLRESFLIVSFLVLVPTLFLRVYTGFFILPFIALLGGLALLSLSKARGHRLRQVVVITAVVATFVFSSAMLQYELDNLTSISTTNYSTGTYLARQHPGVISNDGLLGVRVAAMCECAYLPIGGAGTTFQSPELLAYGYFKPSEIYQGITALPLSQITLDSDSPWTVASVNAELDWVKIMQSPFNQPAHAASRYRPVFYLENRNIGENFFAFGNTYPSLFAQSAHEGAYLLYQSPTESLYYIYAP